MATSSMDFFNAGPNNGLLLGREENEAYCRARPGKEYLVYFPQEGEVELELSEVKMLSVQRLEILTGTWIDEEILVSENRLRLSSPGKHFLFLVINH